MFPIGSVHYNGYGAKYEVVGAWGEWCWVVLEDGEPQTETVASFCRALELGTGRHPYDFKTTTTA